MTPDTAQAFHKGFYDSNVWMNQIKFLGVPCLKNPLDLWIYQEIIFERKPKLIIETGICMGGSALFLAHMLDLVDPQVEFASQIVSIDIIHDGLGVWPKHPRLEYITGSSTDADVFKNVASRAQDGGEVLVILDSDHRKSHVLDEMNLYAPLVRPGGYMIVEDSNINGHPVAVGFGDGPWEAVEAFLPEHPEFEIDGHKEKFFFTFNPWGYLRKTRW